MNITRNRLVVGLLVAVGAIASITFATQSEAAVSRDCSTNSIIKCGVTSMDELRGKYNNSSELRNLFAHFGITSGQINGGSGKVRNGIVHYDGRVTVDGKTVATNAKSVGRNLNQGGTAFTVNGKKYYKGSPSQRFVKGANLDAYVVYDSKGNFVAAIIKACGNPVEATPPAPKPTYACKNLTAQTIKSTDGKTNKVTFTASGSAANGAKIVSYTYNFGDGKSYTTTSNKHTHTYAKAGTYKATVHVNVSVNGKTVKVTGKDCAVTVKVTIPVVKPADVKCSALDLQKISETSFNLKASATATTASNTQKAGVINGYVFTVKDASGKTVKSITKTTSSKSSQSGAFTLQPGKYTASVVVKSNVGDKTSKACEVTIEVPAPKQIQVCRLSDYVIVTINEKDFDSKKHSKNLSDCEKVQVCDTTTNKVVTVNKEEAKKDRYTTDLSQCENVKVCDLTTNKVVEVTKREAKEDRYTTDLTQCENVEVCDTTTNKVVTVTKNEAKDSRYTTDLDKCAEVPVTPPETPETPVVELPHTGAADVLLSLFGAGSLIAATSYYVASRRAING